MPRYAATTRRNPIRGDPDSGAFETEGARGTARFVRRSASLWDVDVERYPRGCRLSLSARKADLRSDVGDYLGTVQLESAVPASDLLCDVPPGVARGAAVEWATLEAPVRGHGVALGMYTLLAMQLPRGTALVAHGCVEGGSTSDEAERVWLSIERESPVGARGFSGVALRQNGSVTSLAHMLRAVRGASQYANGRRATLVNVRATAGELGVPFDGKALDELVASDLVIRTKNGRVRATVSPEGTFDQEDTEAEIARYLSYRLSLRTNAGPPAARRPPTVRQVAQAIYQLEHAVDEPERLTPAVLRVLRAAGWREGDPVHDPRVDYRRFDAQMVVSDLSGPGFDLAGEMWR